MQQNTYPAFGMQQRTYAPTNMLAAPIPNIAHQLATKVPMSHAPPVGKIKNKVKD